MKLPCAHEDIDRHVSMEAKGSEPSANVEARLVGFGCPFQRDPVAIF